MFSGRIYEDWMHDIQKKKMEEILDTVTLGKRILDIGGGPGFFEEYESNAISIDIDLFNLKKTSSRKVLADGDNLPFKHGCFDQVFCLDAIHLLKDKREFWRVLRDKGEAVVSMPCNRYNIGEKFRILKERFQDWSPKNEFFVGDKEMDAVIICEKLQKMGSI